MIDSRDTAVSRAVTAVAEHMQDVWLNGYEHGKANYYDESEKVDFAVDSSKGATKIDKSAHTVMEFKANPDWHETTSYDGYLAYYHEEGLYSVRHKKKGIVCLVNARSPLDAIHKVRRIDEQ